MIGQNFHSNKLSELLLFEVLPYGAIPVYDIDGNQEVIYATKNDAGHVKCNGRYFAHTHAIQSEKLTTNEINKAIERMFVEILTNMHVPIAMSEFDAVDMLNAHDIGFSRIITKNDVQVIPFGMALAVCPSEHLGRIYAYNSIGNPTEWGAFMFNIENALVFFSVNASITQIETSVLKFVDNCVKNGWSYDQCYASLNDIKMLMIEAGIGPSLRTEELLKEQIVKEIHAL